MRLGVNLGYRLDAREDDGVALAREAERLGYAVAFVAEAYGSDAATVLTWVAAHTERIGIASAVLQIPARSPAMTAMTAATLDALSGGRFTLGLGVSGPQVSEGWHGVPFAAPLARTREYVAIVRSVLARDRVTAPGPHYPLPLAGGPGIPLRLALHPVRERVPVYLAAAGPRNVELAGEIADGWLALFFSPAGAGETMAALRRGRAAAAAGTDLFDVVATVPVSVGPDVAACADRVRDYAALYLGGMGSREQNFYLAQAARMGYGDAAAAVQRHYLAGDRVAAAAAVPLDFLDATSLLGPPDRLARRIGEFAAAGVTTLAVAPHGTPAERLAVLGVVAAAAERAGTGAP